MQFGRSLFGWEFLAPFNEINTNLILFSCPWLPYNSISFNLQ